MSKDTARTRSERCRLGKRIREARLARGWTQAELADRIGAAGRNTYISRFETCVGKRMRPHFREAMSRELGIPLAELVALEEENDSFLLEFNDQVQLAHEYAQRYRGGRADIVILLNELPQSEVPTVLEYVRMLVAKAKKKVEERVKRSARKAKATNTTRVRETTPT